MNGFDWTAASNIASGLATTTANVYSQVSNANNHVNPGAPGAAITPYNPDPVVPKDNTTTYLVVGGLGLLAVGGIVFYAMRKKKKVS